MFLKTKWIFVCNGSSYCLLTDKYIKFKTFHRFPSFSFSGLPSRWRDSPWAPRFLPNRFPIRFGDFRAPARSFWERRRPRSSSGQWCDSQGYPLGSVGEAVWSPFLGLGRSSLVGELPLSDLGRLTLLRALRSWTQKYFWEAALLHSGRCFEFNHRSIGCSAVLGRSSCGSWPHETERLATHPYGWQWGGFFRVPALPHP